MADVEPGAGGHRGEGAQRLRDDHEVGLAGGRLHHQLDVLGKALRRVVTGQVDGDGAVQQRREAVPVPGHAARAGDQQIGAHAYVDDGMALESSVDSSHGVVVESVNVRVLL